MAHYFSNRCKIILYGTSKYQSCAFAAIVSYALRTETINSGVTNFMLSFLINSLNSPTVSMILLSIDCDHCTKFSLSKETIY